MSPSNHFIASWLVAAVTTDNPRDRKLITLAGVLPDVDGLGLLVDIANSIRSGSEISFHYYHKYHHYLLHGWMGAMVVCGSLTIFARQKIRAFLLCLLTFHLHLFCDFIGSRGPGPKDLWPIAYGEPFSHRPFWQWSGQWPLDGWQNQCCFVILLVTALCLSEIKGVSFLEFFGRRVDSTFVNILHRCRALGGRPSAR